MIGRMFRKAIYTDTRALEFSIAVQCLFFGAWLLIVPDAFNSSPAYGILKDFSDECIWGTVFVLVGIAKLWVLHRNDMVARRIIAAIVLALWLIVDASVWMARTGSAAGVVYLVIALSAAWCVVTISVRSKSEYRG